MTSIPLWGLSPKEKEIGIKVVERDLSKYSFEYYRTIIFIDYIYVQLVLFSVKLRHAFTFLLQPKSK
jgi:hypothetical protein